MPSLVNLFSEIFSEIVKLRWYSSLLGNISFALRRVSKRIDGLGRASRLVINAAYIKSAGSCKKGCRESISAYVKGTPPTISFYSDCR